MVKDNSINIIKNSIYNYFEPIINGYTFFKKIKSTPYELEKISKKINKIDNIIETKITPFAATNYKKNSINEIVINDVMLQSKPLIHGDFVSQAAAEFGIASIEYLIEKLSKSYDEKAYLFGINKGGALLANHLAHRMNLPEEQLKKCDYYENKVVCEDTTLNGSIYIIDDVIRSGETIYNVKKYLKNQYPRTKIYTFVLVMTSINQEKYEKAKKIIDYAPWISKHSNVTFPWTQSNITFDNIEIEQILGRFKHKTIDFYE